MRKKMVMMMIMVLMIERDSNTDQQSTNQSRVTKRTKERRGTEHWDGKGTGSETILAVY